jgi:Prokaryotic homologs of the JAB domain
VAVPGSIRLDPGEADRAEWEIRAAAHNTGGYLAGCWHTHPGGGGEPSPADVAAWQSWLEREESRPYTVRRSHWVGLIANETLSGWGNPQWHGWGVWREGFSGKTVLEPAIVRSE